jgi:hypothetical protein
MSTSPQPIVRRPAVSSLALICAAQFVLQLDFSIVNVALATIQRELGFAAADLLPFSYFASPWGPFF